MAEAVRSQPPARAKAPTTNAAKQDVVLHRNGAGVGGSVRAHVRKHHQQQRRRQQQELQGKQGKQGKQGQEQRGALGARCGTGVGAGGAEDVMSDEEVQLLKRANRKSETEAAVAMLAMSVSPVFSAGTAHPVFQQTSLVGCSDGQQGWAGTSGTVAAPAGYSTLHGPLFRAMASSDADSSSSGCVGGDRNTAEAKDSIKAKVAQKLRAHEATQQMPCYDVLPSG